MASTKQGARANTAPKTRKPKPKKKVLVTGAAGTIGTAVREHLGDRYKLFALTRQEADFPSHVADIADFQAIRPAFEGMDAVVHMAAAPGVTEPWERVLPNNLIGTYNVFEAARQAGVKTVVFASSNHAVGMYERDGAPEIYEPGHGQMVDHRMEVRPDGLYGVSKVYGEAMGRYYHEMHGLHVHCLRIGSVRKDDGPVPDRMLEKAPALLEQLETKEQRRKRWNAVWLSQRDCAELIAAALDADDVPWSVVYGVSDNPGRFWDISHAREVLGWVPRDGSPE